MLPARCTVLKPPLYGLPVASHTGFSRGPAAALHGLHAHLHPASKKAKSLHPTRRRRLLCGSTVTLQMTGQITIYLRNTVNRPKHSTYLRSGETPF